MNSKLAKITRALCILGLFGAAHALIGQDTVSCTELRVLETTVCEAIGGTATIAVHTGSSYTVTTFDTKSWALNKPLLLQKEADAEAAREKEKANDLASFGKPAPTPKAALPSADYLNSKAASIHTKKQCVAAGFSWDKKVCYFQ